MVVNRGLEGLCCLGCNCVLSRSMVNFGYTWSWVLLPLESMGLVLVTPEKWDTACGTEPAPAKVQGEAPEYGGNSLILNNI